MAKRRPKGGTSFTWAAPVAIDFCVLAMGDPPGRALERTASPSLGGCPFDGHAGLSEATSLAALSAPVVAMKLAGP